MLNDGRIAGIREPHEGHEELEAIPHAFAVEFNDGEGPWSLFCDNAEEKLSRPKYQVIKGYPARRDTLL